MNNYSSKILKLILENEEQNSKTLRLIASENLPDIDSRLPFLLDMYARYAFSGEQDETTGYFPQYNLREVENETKVKLSNLLNSKFINVRPISGMNTMIVAIAAFTQPGDLVLSFSPQDGGHGETHHILKSLNLRNQAIPFDQSTWTIDLEKFSQLPNLEEVKVVYLDLCMVLFPQPIAELRSLLPKHVKIIYDASHVLGLICGKQFQQPLSEGADVLVGSTHKTFPGPHKGIIACNKLTYAIKLDAVSYHYVSHHHIADVACLGLIAEKGSSFFENYAKQTIQNAQALGAALTRLGVKVEFKKLGFTKSHQIWLDCGPLDYLNIITKKLYQIGIIVNTIKIPTLNGRWGIRIGLQEATQLGITQEGIEMLAKILAEVIHGNDNLEYLENLKLNLIEKQITNFFRNKHKVKELINLYEKENLSASRS